VTSIDVASEMTSIEEPLIRTESLGGSALSRAARAGELDAWYRAIPSTPDAWRAYAREVVEGASSGWLDALSPAISPSGAAAERLAKAARGGLVVTTGQQPGLFGGALMTFVKALSARALADELESVTGLPVAPVFWSATDDADFEEAAVVSVLLDGGARQLTLEQHAAAGTPMARTPIGAEVTVLADLLRASCGSAPSASYLEMAVGAFCEGAMIGDAYTSLLRQVLEPLGISVLDISHPAATQASQPFLRRAAVRANEVEAAVRIRDEEIRAASFTPQVDAVAGLSLVALNSEGAKRRLPLAEAAAMDRDVPGGDAFLSTTVLLRPVLERVLLPTAAYLGGPGEVAYFAQVSAVADALGVPRPLVLPRWSTTIVEPRIQRILNSFGVDVDAFADPHAVERGVARARIGAETEQAIAALRRDLDTSLERLRATAESLVSRDVVDGVRRNIEHRIARLERRLAAGVKRRDVDTMTQLGTARGALYPHGVRQERKLAWIPMLARYGAPLAERMIDAARAHARSVMARQPVRASLAASAPARV